MTQEGLDYIKAQLAQGVSEEAIRSTLVTGGWQQTDVDQGFQTIKSGSATPSNITPPPQPLNNQPLAQNQPDELSNQMAMQSGGKKSSKVLLIVLGALIILIGAGVGGYLYYFAPARVFARAYQTDAKLMTLAYDGSLEIIVSDSQNLTQSFPGYFNKLLANNNIKTALPQVAGVSAIASPAISASLPGNTALDLTTTFSGSTDQKDPNSVKDQMNFTLGGKTGIPGYDLVTHKLKMDVRLLGDIGYFQINEVPEFIYPYTKTMMKQWIKVDSSELKSSTDESNADINKKIDSVAVKDNPVKITKQLKMEKLNGVYVLHYQYALDKTKLKALISDLDGIINSSVNGSASSPMTNEVKEINDEIDKMPAITGEMKIGMLDNHLYYFTVNVPLKDTSSSINGSVDLKMNFSKFNQDVDITAPSDSKTIDDVMASLYGEDSSALDLVSKPQSL